MKYIIVSQHDLEMAIIFDEILSHRWVANDRPVVSAGMCNKQGVAWGESVTLGIKSRPQDTEILQESIKRQL